VEVLLNILVELGFLGSIALLLWGMVLCAMLRFGDGSHRRLARARDRELGVQPVSGSPDPAHPPPDDAPEFNLSRAGKPRAGASCEIVAGPLIHRAIAWRPPQRALAVREAQDRCRLDARTHGSRKDRPVLEPRPPS
jgi:hypothetical protein